MKTKALDTVQGIASEVVEVIRSEGDTIETLVANISLEDEDQVNISFGEGSTAISLWIPLDRIRQLVNIQAQEEKKAGEQ